MALIFAWFCLIGLVAGGIGYVYLSEPPVQMAENSEEKPRPPEEETAKAQPTNTQPANTQPAAAQSDESTEPESTTAEAETDTSEPSSSEEPQSTTSSQETSAGQPESAEMPASEAAPEQDTARADAPEAPAETSGKAAAPEGTPAPSTPDASPTAEAESAPQPAKQSTAETSPPTTASVAAEPPAAQAAESKETSSQTAVQQAALPRVTAPDHQALPLWQRNRQNIDRRWLKDANGKPKPRIAFVLSELGHARIAAEEIIKKLPPAITLSFSPYAKPRALEYLSALARANGHEVMLDLPLEPIDFPQRDPGPNALLTALEPSENLERLNWSLDRSTGYVGVAVWMGSRFVASPRQMRPLFEAIEDRGLVLLDNAEREDSLTADLANEFKVPTLTSHRYVDVPLASRDAIDARLAQVERIALQFGSAIAMGRPFPVTVERLAEWSKEIEKRGIVLVPITVLAEEVARKQELAQRAPARNGNPQTQEASPEPKPADQ